MTAHRQQRVGGAGDLGGAGPGAARQGDVDQEVSPECTVLSPDGVTLCNNITLSHPDRLLRQGPRRRRPTGGSATRRTLRRSSPVNHALPPAASKRRPTLSTLPTYHLFGCANSAVRPSLTGPSYGPNNRLNPKPVTQKRRPALWLWLLAACCVLLPAACCSLLTACLPRLLFRPRRPRPRRPPPKSGALCTTGFRFSAR